MSDSQNGTQYLWIESSYLKQTCYIVFQSARVEYMLVYPAVWLCVYRRLYVPSTQ